MIPDQSYLTIQAFMVNELQLSGTELLAYALVHGYSQDGKSVYYGGNAHLCEWCGASKRTIIRTMQSLCDKGLVVRHLKNGEQSRPMYWTAKSRVTKWHTQGCQNGTPPGDKMAPNKKEGHKKEDTKTPYSPPFFDSASESITAAIVKWQQHKAEKGGAYKPTGWATLMATFEKNTKLYGDNAVVEIVEYSIANNYQGIVWDRLTKQNGGRADDRQRISTEKSNLPGVKRY